MPSVKSDDPISPPRGSNATFDMPDLQNGTNSADNRYTEGSGSSGSVEAYINKLEETIKALREGKQPESIEAGLHSHEGRISAETEGKSVLARDLRISKRPTRNGRQKSKDGRG